MNRLDWTLDASTEWAMRRSRGKAMTVATANPDATTASRELNSGRAAAVSRTMGWLVESWAVASTGTQTSKRQAIPAAAGLNAGQRRLSGRVMAKDNIDSARYVPA